MARRYEIKLELDKDGIRTFSVGFPDQPDYERVGVWVGKGDVPRCTQCSGLLAAMMASCKHAQAVKRYLASVAPKRK